MKRRMFSGTILGVLGVFVLLSQGFSFAPQPEAERGNHAVFSTQYAARFVGSNGGDVFEDFGERIAGVYYVTRQPDAGPSRILTIFADGNVSSIQSSRFGGGVGGGGFSNQQGQWMRVGDRKIAATVLDLSFVPSTGDFFGTAIARYDLHFDHAFQTVEGQAQGKIFGPGVDPQDPDGADVLGEFSDQFVAQRVDLGDLQGGRF